MFGNYDVVTDFSSYLPFTFFFMFVEAAKKLKTERKETGIFFNTVFIFGVYDYFVGGGNVFLEH